MRFAPLRRKPHGDATRWLSLQLRSKWYKHLLYQKSGYLIIATLSGLSPKQNALEKSFCSYLGLLASLFSARCWKGFAQICCYEMNKLLPEGPSPCPPERTYHRLVGSAFVRQPQATRLRGRHSHLQWNFCTVLLIVALWYSEAGFRKLIEPSNPRDISLASL